MRCSLLSTRRCTDQKAELIYQYKFTTIEEAKKAVFEYIEVWYNRKRLHSS
ncbi:MAG: hypothetical protein EOP48_35050 [Sphingobacteriales bacterium]|nr:MAG: hypothetical protein EOP48_35050 [Sphingobacteriales bacterium]